MFFAEQNIHLFFIKLFIITIEIEFLSIVEQFVFFKRFLMNFGHLQVDARFKECRLSATYLIIGENHIDSFLPYVCHSRPHSSSAARFSSR